MFDHHVHAYLRALTAGRSHQIGPFLAAFDDHDAGLFRNYAIPDDDAQTTPGQVADLIAAFTEVGRTPRLEYIPGLCPAVQPALIDAGFIPERRLPVMTCAPSDPVAMPVTGEIEVRLATTDEQLRQVARGPKRRIRPGCDDRP